MVIPLLANHDLTPMPMQKRFLEEYLRVKQRNVGTWGGMRQGWRFFDFVKK